MRYHYYLTHIPTDERPAFFFTRRGAERYAAEHGGYVRTWMWCLRWPWH